jgi:hypothetical protein
MKNSSDNKLFPQREASLAAYNIKPMLPGNPQEAERLMINLLVNILNNNLIFDSRSPLNTNDFRIVFEHHTDYPMGSYPGILEQHINVSESQGYGMLILSLMAGCEDALTAAEHTWRFGASSLKDYFDGMLRTVLDFQSPIRVNNRTTRQFSWEMFGYNTGKNETGFTINDDPNICTRGFRHIENNTASAKIAPFANTPGGGTGGGGGTTDYNQNGTTSAADGDMDIIYSLIIAGNQWGNNGRYNYRELALEMLEGFWRSVIHENYRTLLLGDWISSNQSSVNNMLRNGTRASDFMLGHLQVFKDFDPNHNWQEVINATLNVISDIRDGLHDSGSPNNGLLPDFAVKMSPGERWIPAPANFLEGPDDGRYSWNSCRIPWRLGTAYLLYGNMPMTGNLSNPSLLTYSIKPLNDYAKARISDRSTMCGLDINYDLNSTLASSSQSAYPGFAAPFLVTATAMGDDQRWVDDFWAYPGLSNFQNNWYADYHKLIIMLTASGNFWKP